MPAVLEFRADFRGCVTIAVEVFSPPAGALESNDDDAPYCADQCRETGRTDRRSANCRICRAARSDQRAGRHGSRICLAASIYYGNATDIAYSDDPCVIVNMSVWESMEAMRDYIYRSKHVQVFRERAKWFEKMDRPNYCLWRIPAGHIPTVAEGRERLEHYQAHGDTEFSFWFSRRSTVSG
jgi:hypothetical protein